MSRQGVSTNELEILRFVDKLCPKLTMANINFIINLITRSTPNEKVGCFAVFVQVSCSKTQILENGSL